MKIVINNTNNMGYFISRNTRIILFKKVDIPKSWQDFRGIGIAPAWLMIL